MGGGSKTGKMGHPGKAQSRSDERGGERKGGQNNNFLQNMETSRVSLPPLVPLCLPRSLTLMCLFLLLVTLHLVPQGMMGESMRTGPVEHSA